MTPDEQRDVETLGTIATTALRALTRIHALAIEPEPDSLERITSIASDAILDGYTRINAIHPD